jgi:hypothetical protein
MLSPSVAADVKLQDCKGQNSDLWKTIFQLSTINGTLPRTLLRHGRKRGSRIKELITIVSYSTFWRWIREMEATSSKQPVKLPLNKEIKFYLSAP